jgi:hypothetical protein
MLRLLEVQAAQLVQHWGECGAFAAVEFFADGERFAEEWHRLRFTCLAEFPRELPKIEEGRGKFPPKTAIAARLDYCPAKGLGGGELVPMSPCGARCIKPLRKQRFRVGHVRHLRERFVPGASRSGDATSSSAPSNGRRNRALPCDALPSNASRCRTTEGWLAKRAR